MRPHVLQALLEGQCSQLVVQESVSTGGAACAGLLEYGSGSWRVLYRNHLVHDGR